MHRGQPVQICEAWGTRGARGRCFLWTVTSTSRRSRTSFGGHDLSRPTHRKCMADVPDTLRQQNQPEVAMKVVCLKRVFLILLLVSFSTFGIAAQKEKHDRQPQDNGINELFGKIERHADGTLRSLDSPSPKIVDKDLEPIGEHKELRSLSLAFTKNLTDTGLARLAGLKKLQKLNLGGCRRVTDAGLKACSALKSLETLNLSMTQISDGGIALLVEFTNLRELDLDNTEVTDDGLQHVARLKKLEFLRLADLPVSDQGLKNLASLQGLRTVILDGTAITDASLEAIGSMKSLTRVSLRNTRVTAAGAAALRNRNVKLTVIGP